MLHIIATNGGRYLSLAKAKLQRLIDTGLRYATQTLDVDDTRIVVQVRKDTHFIKLLLLESLNYQFFTTGATKLYGASVSLGFDTVRGYALIAANKGAPKASSVDADPRVPPAWVYESDPLNVTDDFPLRYLWQIEAIPQYAFYPRDTAPNALATGVAAYPMLASSWSQASPLLSLSTLGGVTADTSRFDMAYDIAPAVFQTIGSPQGLPGGLGLAPDADWYRRSAVRRVEHPQHGVRWFVILSDVSNTFHIYPLEAPPDENLLGAADAAWPGQAIKTSVPELYVKRFAAPVPAWARVPSLSGRQWVANNAGLGNLMLYLQAIPQHLWTFNSTATRACSVLFENLPTYSFPTIGGKPLNYSVPNTGVAPDITESLPGLLEVAIDIALTGPDLNNWTASVTSNYELRPTVDNVFVVGAGYAWAIASAALDDLILMKGEVYFPSATRQAVDTSILPGASKCLLKVTNATQNATVQSLLLYNSNYIYSAPWYLGNAPSQLWTADAQLLAFDLRMLSFVVQQRYTKQLVSGDFQTAVKVCVYVDGQVKHSAPLSDDADLLTELDAAHAATADGVSLYAPNDVGAYNAGSANGERYCFYNNMSLWWGSSTQGDLHDASAYMPWASTFAGYGGSFNAGAYLYASKIAKALSLGYRGAFTVHPNGCWSVTTDPIFCYTSPTPSRVDTLDLASMRQTYLDLLFDGKNKTLHSGLHRRSFNNAFKKAQVEADYFYNFTQVSTTLGDFPPGLDHWVDSYSGEWIRGAATFLKVQHASDSNVFFYIVVGCYVQIYASDTGLEYAVPKTKFYLTSVVHPTYIDARFPSWNAYRGLPLISFTGHLSMDSVGKRVYSLGLTATSTDTASQESRIPFLRGSSMFYGG